MKNLALSGICIAVIIFSRSVFGAESLTWESQKLIIETKTIPEKYEASFKYKNVSSKTVQFIKVKGSCGCIIVDTPVEIKAGEEGEIKFKAPVPRAGGKYTKAISVNTNEKAGIEYKLNFTLTNTDPYVPRPPKDQATQNNPYVPRSPKDRKIQDEQTTPRKVTPYKSSSRYLRPKKMGRRQLQVEKLMAILALTRKNSFYTQDECPFLPLPIDPKLYHDFEGLRIYTCCEQCLALVKESPYHAIIKLAEKTQTPILVKVLKPELE